jgi:hypothetical protein
MIDAPAVQEDEVQSAEDGKARADAGAGPKKRGFGGYPMPG